jgi:archaeal type IV pilus assembly protein PilA
MKTLRKIRKSTKALSPVVASIILIAVTVAVSIAVAAWMGALTIGFMATEEVRITNVAFEGTDAIVTAKNTGSSIVTITEAYIGNNPASATNMGAIDPGAEIQVTIPGTYTSGTAYQFKLMSAKGNVFVYTATAPTAPSE